MRFIQLGRREFITLIGGAAAAWPLGARAQQGTRVRRLGVLFAGSKNQFNERREDFLNALRQLGWAEGNNIQIDYRWTDDDIAQTQAFARELVSLKPDAILAQTTPVVSALRRETRNIPIVFVAVTDPVASGFVASLARPGGNITGFSNFEPTLVGKHIEILKEISPGMTAVLDMFNPDANVPRSIIIRPLLEEAARYQGIEFIPAPVRNDVDIERVISSLGDKPTTGLIVAGEPFLGARLDLINSLTMRYRVPAVYTFRFLAEAGGLISYGNNVNEQYRQAASYIDRILKGANPADLPIQTPTKYEMVINLKTAKAMGLTIPPALLSRADEVIE
jgi:putative ABC transport system substrate-binding protein